MAGPPHHFIPNLNNQQGLRNQFGGAMSNPMNNTMQNPLANQGMQVQMGPNPSLSNSMMGQLVPSPVIGNQIVNTMGSQMNTSMANQMNGIGSLNNAPNQMMNQISSSYSMNNPAAQMQQQQQNSNSLQMQAQTNMGGLQHSAMPQQSNQSQVMQSTANVVATPTPPAQPQPQQSKEFNTASLCRIGQETVQDIVSRTQEVFQTLKVIQPPNGTTPGTNTSNEKKVKVQEQLRTIRVLFKRLRLIYEKCNENCQTQGMEYTHIESLIPYRDEIDPKHDEKKNTEAYRMACEESKEIMEQVVLKNKQLKEVIDHLRRIIWEINTMLTMRRS